MSKYIIEIKPEYEDKFKGVMILGAENSNLYVDSNTVDELEELTADYINEHFGDLQDTAYQRGFEDGKKEAESSEAIERAKADAFNNGMLHKGEKIHEAYQRGLDDAWEAAKKIANMWTRIGNNELLAIFGITERIGHSTIRALFEKQTANEAMLELEAYEEKQDNKFEFGDEITNSYGTKGCVVSKDNEEGEMIYALFDGYRVPQHVAKSKYRKTGKHYDIEKILEAMKHD